MLIYFGRFVILQVWTSVESILISLSNKGEIEITATSKTMKNIESPNKFNPQRLTN